MSTNNADPKGPSPKEPSPAGNVRINLAQKIQNVQDHMDQKERLMLTYVFEQVPHPYYTNWKQEFNDIFAQMVRLKVRQKSMSSD